MLSHDKKDFEGLTDGDFALVNDYVSACMDLAQTVLSELESNSTYTVQIFKMKIPWGSWTEHGRWIPNAAVEPWLSAEEQRKQNEENGYSCNEN